jgi:hypothetical protein
MRHRKGGVNGEKSPAVCGAQCKAAWASTPIGVWSRMQIFDFVFWEFWKSQNCTPIHVQGIETSNHFPCKTPVQN